jgi:hypothetical protein
MIAPANFTSDPACPLLIENDGYRYDHPGTAKNLSFAS